MANLIVVRLVPPKAIHAADFTGYLDPAGLGPLQISAYNVSFSDPAGALLIGTAIYAPPAAQPGAPVSYDPSHQQMPISNPPNYGVITRIAQQADPAPGARVPNDPVLWTNDHFEFESVATAVIEVVNIPAIENLRLVASWGAGLAPQVTTQ